MIEIIACPVCSNATNNADGPRVWHLKYDQTLERTQRVFYKESNTCSNCGRVFVFSEKVEVDPDLIAAMRRGDPMRSFSEGVRRQAEKMAAAPSIPDLTIQDGPQATRYTVCGCVVGKCTHGRDQSPVGPYDLITEPAIQEGK